jgi:hypothetical protein
MFRDHRTYESQAYQIVRCRDYEEQHQDEPGAVSHPPRVRIVEAVLLAREQRMYFGRW